MGRKNNSFPVTRGRFFCKWRKRRACTLRALEMMKKGCWGRSSGTLPDFHKDFSPKNAARCMWLRSTLRWLSQRGASAVAARCARWATADGETEGQAAAYRQAVCTGAHCTIGPKKQEGREEGYGLAGSGNCAVGKLSAHDELVAIGLRSHAGKLAELLVEIASARSYTCESFMWGFWAISSWAYCRRRRMRQERKVVPYSVRM